MFLIQMSDKSKAQRNRMLEAKIAAPRFDICVPDFNIKSSRSSGLKSIRLCLTLHFEEREILPDEIINQTRMLGELLDRPN